MKPTWSRSEFGWLAVVTILVLVHFVREEMVWDYRQPAEPALSRVANRSHLYLCELSSSIHELTARTMFGSEQHFSLLQFSPGTLSLIRPVMLMKNLDLVYWSLSPYIWLGAEQCLMKLVGSSDITRYLIRQYIQWQLLPRLPLLGWHLGCDETKWTDFLKEFYRPYTMPMPCPHNNVILIKSQD